MKTIKARVESAILDEKASGIFITYTDMTDKDINYISSREEKQGVFVPLQTWGKVPAGANPKNELQKIANLLNGCQPTKNGMMEAIPNWKPKIINIEIE